MATNGYWLSIQTLISQASRSEQSLYHAGGVDASMFETEKEFEQWKPPYEELLQAFYDGIKEVAFLQRHTCSYGEDDYCFYCHRDGRA